MTFTFQPRTFLCTLPNEWWFSRAARVDPLGPNELNFSLFGLRIHVPRKSRKRSCTKRVPIHLRNVIRWWDFGIYVCVLAFDRDNRSSRNMNCRYWIYIRVAEHWFRLFNVVPRNFGSFESEDMVRFSGNNFIRTSSKRCSVCISLKR